MAPYLLVLVGGDGDELRFPEGDVGHQAVAGAHTDDVQLRLILMEGVQHDLEQTQVHLKTATWWTPCPLVAIGGITAP